MRPTSGATPSMPHRMCKTYSLNPQQMPRPQRVYMTPCTSLDINKTPCRNSQGARPRTSRSKNRGFNISTTLMPHLSHLRNPQISRKKIREGIIRALSHHCSLRALMVARKSPFAYRKSSTRMNRFFQWSRTRSYLYRTNMRC